MNIKQFTASINNKGILKNNKYHVTIGFAPGHYLNQSQADLRLLEVRCDTVTLPGVSFVSADGPPRLGYGPVEKHPYNVSFDDLALTFMVDAGSEVHKALYNWANIVINYKGTGGATTLNTKTGPGSGKHKAYEVGYRDKYAATITINVYNDTGTKTMTFEAYNAFPMGFPSSGLSWAEGELLRINIPFAYTDYTVTYSGDPVAPVETGKTDQQVQTEAPPEIPAPNREIGIDLGSLPVGQGRIVPA